MSRTENSWDKSLQVFDPGEVLTGQRSQEFYCTREYSPFRELRDYFRPTDRYSRPSTAFLAGHRGSGKSSLLLRVLTEFTDPYFVVYFDVNHNLDSAAANQIDLLYLLGATIYQVAAKEGLEIDVQYLEGLVRSIYTMTHRTDEIDKGTVNVGELVKDLVCFGAGMIAGGIGGQLAEMAFKPFTLSSGISEETAAKREIEPQVQTVIDNVNLIISEVQRKSGKSLLVVVDGLDKLQRPEQADLIFIDSRAWSGPICRIIYTVPMTAFTSPRFGQAEGETKSFFMPNVKLFDKTGVRGEEGYAHLREVVTKRMSSIGQAPDDAFEPGALDLLIFKSGGVMRDFIWLVRDAISAARIMELDKVNRASAERAIDERVTQMTLRLSQTAVNELRQVRHHKLHSGNEESRELLHGLYIVAYRNKNTWFDAHPLLWDVLDES